jgi:phage major head subunit gpT-like protein
MDINRGNMDVLFQDFRVEFTAGFNDGRERSILDNIATVVPSTGATTLHAWLNQIPKMREWIGPRNVRNIESNKLVITNRKFEGTIEMTREEIEDDLHGLYRPVARALGEGAAVHPDELCVDAILAGTSTNWADDAAFFGDSRVYGSNTIDNLHAAAWAADGAAFEAAYELMTSYLGHNDEPLNVIPVAVLHGPSIRGEVFDVLTNDFRASSNAAIQNRNRGLVKSIQSSRLVGAHAAKWALIGTIAGINPVVYQQRKRAEFQGQRFKDESEFTFEFDKYQMGVRSRGEAFLALPHLIVGGNL